MSRLLASAIESAERLEILLYLRTRRGKALAVRTVAAACRLPAARVEQDLAALCGRGFLTVSTGSDLLYSYEPISPWLDAVVTEIEVIYASDRDVIDAALPGGRRP